ncbi:hypothetical protein ABZ372_28855, partial [Streptomyces sp. NPDC005921]
MEVLLEQLASAAAVESAATATGSGDPWRQTWTYLAGGLMDDGVVADGAYVALPYLVEAVAALPPGQTADFWVDLGFIVTADRLPPVPGDLEAGFGAALRLAEQAAARSLLAAGVPAQVCAHLVLACVAFAGHYTGEALNRLLGARESGLLLVCPGCGSDTEIAEFFVDPAGRPSEVPGVPAPAPVRPGGHPWGEFAAALREEALGEGWEAFLRVAREVAVAGVTPETPGPAVLCLVAGMVAVRGTPQGAAREFARQLMSLTGHFRCWDCERTWASRPRPAPAPRAAPPRSSRARRTP